MTRISRRAALAFGALTLVLPSTGAGQPAAYVLDTEASQVGFGFRLAGSRHTGTMPVSSARVILDPGNLAASSVEVTLDAGAARTALPFAAEAMLGSLILDTKRYPEIRFVSTGVVLGRSGRISDGAALKGNLTIRDVTRPITLAAAVYRPQGTAPDDLSRLTVFLTGSVSRSAFGASGYPDLVEDRVSLDIRAVIRAK